MSFFSLCRPFLCLVQSYPPSTTLPFTLLFRSLIHGYPPLLLQVHTSCASKKCTMTARAWKAETGGQYWEKTDNSNQLPFFLQHLFGVCAYFCPKPGSDFLLIKSDSNHCQKFTFHEKILVVQVKVLFSPLMPNGHCPFPKQNFIAIDHLPPWRASFFSERSWHKCKIHVWWMMITRCATLKIWQKSGWKKHSSWPS